MQPVLTPVLAMWSLQEWNQFAAIVFGVSGLCLAIYANIKSSKAGSKADATASALERIAQEIRQINEVQVEVSASFKSLDTRYSLVITVINTGHQLARVDDVRAVMRAGYQYRRILAYGSLENTRTEKELPSNPTVPGILPPKSLCEVEFIGTTLPNGVTMTCDYAEWQEFERLEVDVSTKTMIVPNGPWRDELLREIEKANRARPPSICKE